MATTVVLDRLPTPFLSIDGRDAARDLTRRVVKLEVEESTKKATKISLTLEDVDASLSDGEVLASGMVIGARLGQRGSMTVTTNVRSARRFRSSEHHFAYSGVWSTIGD